MTAEETSYLVTLHPSCCIILTVISSTAPYLPPALEISLELVDSVHSVMHPLLHDSQVLDSAKGISSLSLYRPLQKLYHHENEKPQLRIRKYGSHICHAWGSLGPLALMDLQTRYLG